MTDGDLAAIAAAAPLLASDNPAAAASPFDDKTSHHDRADGSLIEVWQRGRPLGGDGSPWVTSLPLADEVFASTRVTSVQEVSRPLMPADVTSSSHNL